MRRQSSTRSDYCCYNCHLLLLLLLLAALVLQISSQLATSGSTVEYLPGFEGPLPFHLQTGYVGVGESEDAQLFYYFIESENNPKEDPLFLWITGGPGCSSFSGLIYEIGPIAFKAEEYNGGVPNLILRPQSWTKVCSIIFVDLPVGSGFSYAKTPNPQRSDYQLVHHAYEFLRKWLVDHPRYLSNQVYFGADSYSGITIPAIVQEISIGNEKGVQPWINIQGYTLGNPLTDRREFNFEIPYAHGMGLISDELYMSLQKNCKGEYLNIDSENVLCSRDVDSFNELISGVNRFHILERKCEVASPMPHEVVFWRRSLTDKLHDKFPSTYLTLPPLCCQNYVYFLCKYWANDDNVRKALHIRKGSIGKWTRCNRELYKYEISSSFEYHVNLSKKGYRSLIYSGDHDLVVPFMATQAWIRDLNYSIVDDWRPWLVDGQVAGYTRTYSNQMTFATVKGAGHTAPEYKPEESLAMFNRWMSNKPL